MTVERLIMRSPRSLTTHTVQPKIVGFSLDSIVALMVITPTGSGALVCSRKVIVGECEPGLYDALIEWIRNRGLPVRSVTDPDESGDIPTLSTKATFYSFVFLRRRKYSATRLTNARMMGASLVRVRFPDIDGSTWTWCGAIEDLVELVYGKQRVILAHMRWLAPWAGEMLDNWKDL